MSRQRHSKRSHTVSDLLQIAWSQKVLIICLLGHLVLWLGFIGVTVIERELDDRDDFLNIALILSVVIGIVSGIFNCLVEMKLSGAVVAVLVAILSAIPCIGLFLILIVNTRATSALQSDGIRVGLLGARIASITDLPESEDDEEEDDEDDRPRRRSRYDVDDREGW
jgi:hypothetical protein